MPVAWIELPYWEEWGAITRIHGSAMIAFDHSKIMLDQPTNDERELIHSHAGSQFKTLKADHLSRIEQAVDLHNMALLRYYSAFETFVRFTDFVMSTGTFTTLTRPLDLSEIEAIESIHLKGGVEAWSEITLGKVKQGWTDVYGGKPGLVEVSLIRNAIAHGVRQMNQSLLETASVRGTTLPFEVGHPITISFEMLNEYRGRLRSYCRIISDGLVHIAKGTHRDA